MQPRPLGRPATEGDGPERYMVRMPLWLSDNARLTDIQQLTLGERIATTVAGQNASLEKLHEFTILRVVGIGTSAAAELLANEIATGLIRLTARKGAAIQFSFPPSEIVRKEEMPRSFRENLPESEYPDNWTLRANGTRTDGGILPHLTYILPEHERIWEYPLAYGKVVRPFDVSDVTESISTTSRLFPLVTLDANILAAAHALWAACAQYDRRLTYILLVTALDVLAQDEIVQNWAVELKDVITSIKDSVSKELRGKSSEEESSALALLRKLSRKIDEIGQPGMADRVRALVLRAFGIEQQQSPEGRQLVKEINAILGKRGGLAHGGRFLEPPTADENERLRAIVATAFETKFRDLSRAKP